MDPNMKYPFNVRSFFTPEGKTYIGGGVELWRGYFQSVRPAIGRMLINLDISTGMMYQPGPLIGLCLEFLGASRNGPAALSPSQGFPDRERLRLQRFISGVRVTTPYTATTGGPRQARVIKKLSSTGADAITFQMRGGSSMTVADYFRTHVNRTLKFPKVICVEVSAHSALLAQSDEYLEGWIWRSHPA